MRCPKCDGETKVVDCRDQYYGKRRRRVCKWCGHRFTTQERLTKSDTDISLAEFEEFKKWKSERCSNGENT